METGIVDFYIYAKGIAEPPKKFRVNLLLQLFRSHMTYDYITLEYRYFLVAKFWRIFSKLFLEWTVVMLRVLHEFGKLGWPSG